MLLAVVKYSWTFLNPGRRFACCPKDEKKQYGYMTWVDPEWDDRAFGVLVKLMKKNVQAEEDAKNWEEELAKANRELREIRNEIKTVW
ncbi:hypothetical protein SETIT_4G183500v2 [Setaria italica]|uniref:Zinc finger GRF-type domain-containing protein n=1 Tax=Setaria italica TaxID=4555 RepID=K3Y0E5_SETIT|nr:hypothetical protein SETIT_4G183500v2 [Setaria italica]